MLCNEVILFFTPSNSWALCFTPFTAPEYVEKSTLDKTIKYKYYRDGGATKRLPEEERYVKAQEAPFELHSGENLKLRIFLDKCVLEVFANGRECMTQRIHPTRNDSLGVALFTRGGTANVVSLDARDMAPANSY